MDSLSGQHIVVTGASTGIGRTTAEQLARRGATVSLMARRETLLQEAVDALRADGLKAGYAAADVSDRSALGDAFAEVERQSGPIHGLFANAGTSGAFQALTDYDEDAFDQLLQVNLTSVFWSIKSVLPGMIERRQGSIVVTGSLASERGMPNNAAYVASKHGVLGLAKAAAAEVAQHNVRVNCVLPGLIDTPLLSAIDPSAPLDAIRDHLAKSVPQGRIGTPDDLAQLVCFLMSDAAGHITAQSIAVDGGVLGTLLP